MKFRRLIIGVNDRGSARATLLRLNLHETRRARSIAGEGMQTLITFLLCVVYIENFQTVFSLEELCSLS